MRKRSKVIWVLFAVSAAAVVFISAHSRSPDASGLACSVLTCGVLFLLSVGAMIDLLSGRKVNPPRGFDVLPPEDRK